MFSFLSFCYKLKSTVYWFGPCHFLQPPLHSLKSTECSLGPALCVANMEEGQKTYNLILKEFIISLIWLWLYLRLVPFTCRHRGTHSHPTSSH